MTRPIYCPHCAAENDIDMDLTGIAHGESYHQLVEACNECGLPFVVTVRANFEWGVGTIEWQSQTKGTRAR